VFLADAAATVQISPKPATMTIGESVTVTAQGFDAQGNPTPIQDPRWFYDTTRFTGSVDPQDPCKCTFTAIAPGSAGIMCSDGQPGTGPDDSHTVTIVSAGDLVRSDVTPDQANLKVGEQQQFTATGYDAWGNPVPITPTWTTTGGTINPTTGLYTATVVGDFTVTASVVGSPITGTATVHVDPGPLARIDVTPAEVSLQIGNQQQFLATGRDAQGNPVATSEPVTGDQLRAEVAWPQGDFAALQGQTVALRFAVTKGRLYSFWVEA